MKKVMCLLMLVFSASAVASPQMPFCYPNPGTANALGMVGKKGHVYNMDVYCYLDKGNTLTNFKILGATSDDVKIISNNCPAVLSHPHYCKIMATFTPSHYGHLQGGILATWDGAEPAEYPVFTASVFVDP